MYMVYAIGITIQSRSCWCDGDAPAALPGVAEEPHTDLLVAVTQEDKKRRMKERRDYRTPGDGHRHPMGGNVLREGNDVDDLKGGNKKPCRNVQVVFSLRETRKLE